MIRITSQALEAAGVPLEVGLAQGSGKPAHEEGRVERPPIAAGLLGEAPPGVVSAARPAPVLHWSRLVPPEHGGPAVVYDRYRIFACWPVKYQRGWACMCVTVYDNCTPIFQI